MDTLGGSQDVTFLTEKGLDNSNYIQLHQFSFFTECITDKTIVRNYAFCNEVKICNC